MDKESFRAELIRAGYGKIVEKVMEPANVHGEERAHDVDFRAMILSGIFRLNRDGRSRAYHAGETFEILAGEPHSESVGHEPVRYIGGERQRVTVKSA